MSEILGTPSVESQPRENPELREFAAKLLHKADIRINGKRPWDMQVLRPRVFERALGQGSLGLGESYMDGDWDAQHLDEFFHRLLGPHPGAAALAPAGRAGDREFQTIGFSLCDGIPDCRAPGGA